VNIEAAAEPLLDVRGLRVDFTSPLGTVQAVRDVSYSMSRGEVMALVGESGSGKTASVMALMGLTPSESGRVAGSIRFRGQELMGLPDAAMRDVRGKGIAMVFQDPLSSLNPVLSVGRQIAEGLRRHMRLDRSSARARAIDMLTRVGIPAAATRFDAYPHEFSGGMRQRVMIAMGLACEPALLIADEPTTALDVTTQAQILELLRSLREEMQLSVLLITHNLGLAAGLADHLAVMYAGRIVEKGPVDEVLRNPQHPYTRGLVESVPRLDRPRLEELVPIHGSPPDLSADLPGCSFRPRCPLAVDRCGVDEPPLMSSGAGRLSACWVLAEGDGRR
jgi:oligopeptide/dipeptide ABC transporter ATP-binding protein